jgi:hypothetical protein
VLALDTLQRDVQQRFDVGEVSDGLFHQNSNTRGEAKM